MLMRTEVIEKMPKDAVLTLEQKMALIEAKVSRAEATARSLAEFVQKTKSAERSLYTARR